MDSQSVEIRQRQILLYLGTSILKTWNVSNLKGLKLLSLTSMLYVYIAYIQRHEMKKT